MKSKRRAGDYGQMALGESSRRPVDLQICVRRSNETALQVQVENVKKEKVLAKPFLDVREQNFTVLCRKAATVT